jgi:hypothetical protein
MLETQPGREATMRIMLRWTVLVEEGNAMIDDGSARPRDG